MATKSLEAHGCLACKEVVDGSCAAVACSEISVLCVRNGVIVPFSPVYQVHFGLSQQILGCR